MAASRTINFTRASLDAIKVASSGERIVIRDAKQPGLELRVSATGAKTFSVRRRVKKGDVERITIGAYPTVSIEVARDKAKGIVAQQAVGVSVAKDAKLKKRDSLTFGDALQAFIDAPRDSALKLRTRSDYLGMVRPAGQSKRGHLHGPGELHAIAAKKLRALTGSMVRSLHARLAERSVTRAAYAMRVLRAVCNHHGVRLDDDPFDLKTAKADRLVLPKSKTRDRTIAVERLADWWAAASEVANGDTFQFELLTGMRRGEVAALRRDQVDLEGGRVRLPDTKNGKPHVVMLSRQALQLLKTRAADLVNDDLVFVGAGSPPKALAAIIAKTAIPFSAHDLRRTFATVGAGILPGYTLKKLMNHAEGGDVTAAHYVHLDEKTLRAGWQTIADAMFEAIGASAPSLASNVFSLNNARRKA